MTIASPADSATDFARDWAQWQRDQDHRRTDPAGFLAVTGLYWLGAEPLALPDAPGRWSTSEDGPVVELSDGESIVVDGRTVTGRHEFGPIPERGGATVGFADGVIEVARRGGYDILRPRRGDHPYLASFDGTPAYEPDPRWRIPARFVRYAQGRDVEVGGALDGIRHVYSSPGYLEFDADGGTHRLVVFPGHTAGTLEAIFTDATSGVTTYAANRRVSVAEPGDDGATTIDFTRAANFPCAYTDFATCPLPPAENRLPIAVEAGEKTPVSRVVGHPVAGGIALAGERA